MTLQKAQGSYDGLVRAPIPAAVIAYQVLDCMVSQACRYVVDAWHGEHVERQGLPADQAPLVSTLAALIRVLDAHKPSPSGRCWTCCSPLGRSRGRCLLPGALFEALGQHPVDAVPAVRQRAQEARDIHTADPAGSGARSLPRLRSKRRHHW